MATIRILFTFLATVATIANSAPATRGVQEQVDDSATPKHLDRQQRGEYLAPGVYIEEVSNFNGDQDDKRDFASDEERIPPKMRDEALDQDAKIIAKQFRWGFAASRRHLENQDMFNKFISTMENNDMFAGSAFSRTPGAPARIWIKGDCSKQDIDLGASEFITYTGLELKMTCGMRYSMKEQQERMDAIDKQLAAQGLMASSAVRPGDVILVTIIAPYDGMKIESDRVPSQAMEDSNDFDTLAEAAKAGQNFAAKSLLAGSTATTTDLTYGVFVSVVEESYEPVEANEHARGGRKVRSDTHQCTSGFSVERLSDGVTGIATAAHCTNMHTFDAEYPEGDFALYHKGEHDGTYGDMEWKTTGHVELPEYWANVNDKRYVNYRKTSFSNNDIVCVYSRMQGTRDCDYVYSTSTSQQGSKKLIAMDGYHTTGGDSGGPWSYSTTAAGIHKGYKTIWFKKRNTFSRVSYLDEALGVQVLLN